MSKRTKDMTPEEQEKFLASQAPSTRALLTDNEDEAKSYFQNLPTNIIVSQEDMDSGRSAKPKEMSIEELVVAEVHRKNRAGTQQKQGYLGVMFEDSSIEQSRSQESKDKAVDAFMGVPGVNPPNFERLFEKAARKAKSLFRIKRKQDIK